MIDNTKPCYLVSLDSEKAFNKLWRPGLFYKMLNKFSLNITLIIKTYYDKAHGIIVNNNFKSQIFNIKCGVKQGGKASGHLYNFNVNDYYVEAENRNIGEKL